MNTVEEWIISEYPSNFTVEIIGSNGYYKKYENVQLTLPTNTTIEILEANSSVNYKYNIVDLVNKFVWNINSDRVDKFLNDLNSTSEEFNNKEPMCDLGPHQFEELNKILEETNQNNKCTCDITTLMRTGCTCGGT